MKHIHVKQIVVSGTGSEEILYVLDEKSRVWRACYSGDYQTGAWLWVLVNLPEESARAIGVGAKKTVRRRPAR